MRYRVLATDYDGTLATDGVLASRARAALGRWRASGRRTVLVTGRELSDLRRVCPDLSMFDRVVVENGAALFRPDAGSIRSLSAPVNGELVLRLRAAGALPLGLGRVIVATHRSYATLVASTAIEVGVPVTLAYNRATLMVLPAGIDKGSGLAAALRDLDLGSESAVAVGDAENDVPLLGACARRVAVANAHPELLRVADAVTAAREGAGVAELIDRLLAEDGS